MSSRLFRRIPTPSIFLLSLRAAGTGLNLTTASYVVLYDPWWNPAVEAQAIDRIPPHRPDPHRQRLPPHRTRHRRGEDLGAAAAQGPDDRRCAGRGRLRPQPHSDRPRIPLRRRLATPMTSRERLQAALEHRQPDRVPVDFGATAVTGMHVSIVHRLRQRLLGQPDYRVRVIEPYQMLGEIDEALREALGIDVIGVLGRKSILGTESKDWKPFRLFDGTPCEVSGDFRVTPAPDGGWHIYPEGDTTVPPSGHMPEGGYFFDAIVRQDPIDDDRLDPADNCQEFGPLGAADLAYYRAKLNWSKEQGASGTILSVPGTAFGDIALVPAPFLKHPRGIRDIAEWYVSTKTRPELRAQDLRAAVRTGPPKHRDADRSLRRPDPSGSDHRHGLRHPARPLYLGRDLPGPLQTVPSADQRPHPPPLALEDLHPFLRFRLPVDPGFHRCRLRRPQPRSVLRCRHGAGPPETRVRTGPGLLGRRRGHAKDARLRHAGGCRPRGCGIGSPPSTGTAGLCSMPSTTSRATRPSRTSWPCSKASATAPGHERFPGFA